MARPADPTVRSALKAAALRAFSVAGLHGARIEDITGACGVSKGAFYLHFVSKEALFKEVLESFRARMDALTNARVAEVEAFATRHGTLNAQDFALETPRGQALLELESHHDRLTLELLWDERLVFDVLLRGCKGTEFDGLVWEFTSREVERVQADFERLKSTGCCRTDIPSDVFGSVVVGAWLMVARQMATLEARPDLDAWMQALHRLVREGAAPRPAAASELVTVGSPSHRRSAS